MKSFRLNSIASLACAHCDIPFDITASDRYRLDTFTKNYIIFTQLYLNKNSDLPSECTLRALDFFVRSIFGVHLDQSKFQLMTDISETE